MSKLAISSVLELTFDFAKGKESHAQSQFRLNGIPIPPSAKSMAVSVAGQPLRKIFLTDILFTEVAPSGISFRAIYHENGISLGPTPFPVTGSLQFHAEAITGELNLTDALDETLARNVRA